jgi:hypothetical protein
MIFMSSLVLVAKFNAMRVATMLELVEEEVVVRVEGAVKRPGEYRVAMGTPLEQVLKKAKPFLEADLRGLSLKENIVDSKTIAIERLKTVIVWVTGAVVEEGEIELPVGSRISDLKGKIELKEEADKSFLKRKRKLKNGEKIEVPKKTVELKSAL